MHPSFRIEYICKIYEILDNMYKTKLIVKFYVLDPEGLCRLQNMFETDQEKEEERNSVFSHLSNFF